MRLAILTASLLLTAGLASAQRHKLDINTETPEGQLLQQIGQESDEAKKLGLLEQFAAKYPKHEACVWVYAQMVPTYNKTNQFDKAMDAADKLLALDPEDVEIAHQGLKAAEGKKDPDAVLKWASKTSAIARKVAQSPKPTDEDAVEEWKARVDLAKQIDVYTEYSLYAAALQATDPAKKLMLADALEQQNPQSQYLPQLATQRFDAYIKAGNTAKAIALAEKILEKDQTNEEMMLAVAGNYMAEKKEPQKVLALSQKIVEVVASKPKPAGVDDALWNKRKEQLTGRARWMEGMTYASESKWGEADQALRAALPGLQDDKPMLSEALFFLGLANYRLGEKGQTERIRDALHFNEQCAAIPGRYQGQARTNIRAIKSQYRVQ